MTDQLDLITAIAAKEAAIDEAEAGADEVWFRAALSVVRRIASRGRPFTTDEVWAEIGEPRESRAMGAVMREAARAGIAVPTNEYRTSASVRCHARPKRVWRPA